MNVATAAAAALSVLSWTQMREEEVQFYITDDTNKHTVLLILLLNLIFFCELHLYNCSNFDSTNSLNSP